MRIAFVDLITAVTLRVIQAQGVSGHLSHPRYAHLHGS